MSSGNSKPAPTCSVTRPVARGQTPVVRSSLIGALLVSDEARPSYFRAAHTCPAHGARHYRGSLHDHLHGPRDHLDRATGDAAGAWFFADHGRLDSVELP